MKTSREDPSIGRSPRSAARLSPRRLFLLAVLLPACLLAGTAVAAPPTAADREALKKTLVDLAQRAPFRDARLGVQLVSLDDGSVVFSQNADDLLNPASNVKLVTAAAALARSAPSTASTPSSSPSPAAQRRAVKTLYVRGKGDPTHHHRAALRHGLGARSTSASARSADLVLDDTLVRPRAARPGLRPGELGPRLHGSHRRGQPQLERGRRLPPRLGRPGGSAAVEMEPP